MTTKNIHIWVTVKQLKAIKMALRSTSHLMSTERERAYLRWVIKKLEEQGGI
jgi:hypothetical protein